MLKFKTHDINMRSIDLKTQLLLYIYIYKVQSVSVPICNITQYTFKILLKKSRVYTLKQSAMKDKIYKY